MTTPHHAVVWTGEKLVKIFFEPAGAEERQTAGAILLLDSAKNFRRTAHLETHPRIGASELCDDAEHRDGKEPAANTQRFVS